MSTFKSITFELLSHGQVTDSYLDTPNGKIYREVSVPKSIRPKCSVIVDGVQVNYRFIHDCDEILQSKQILLDKERYSANRKTDLKDREALMFTNGRLITRKQNQNDYLLKCGMLDVLDEGVQRAEDVVPLYRIFDPMKEVEENNSFAEDMSKAFLGFAALAEDDKKAVLFKLFGAHYVIPENQAQWSAAVLQIVNKSTLGDRKNIDLILNYKPTLVEKKPSEESLEDLKLIVGTAINDGFLDFVTNPKQVLSKAGKGASGKAAPVFELDDKWDYETKVDMFANHLFTKEGEPILKVIKSAIKK